MKRRLLTFLLCVKRGRIQPDVGVLIGAMARHRMVKEQLDWWQTQMMCKDDFCVYEYWVDAMKWQRRAESAFEAGSGTWDEQVGMAVRFQSLCFLAGVSNLPLRTKGWVKINADVQDRYIYLV